MKRLNVILDDLALIRLILSDEKIDPVRFGVLAETAGANGLVCTLGGKGKGVVERDLKMLKAIKHSYFNLRMPIDNDAMRVALAILPDMVTFVDISAGDPRKVDTIDPTIHQADIETMLPNLQANNIAVSVLLKPDIESLKAISKLSVDYVELDAREYTGATDINDEIVALDKIKSAALAVGKWGMGVNCSGNIGYEDIDGLAQTPNLEDISMGTALINRSLFVGVERAVGEALQLIRHREID
jgi:pyridoxine 5-phosphate synthase